MNNIYGEVINEIAALPYGEIVKLSFSVSKGDVKRAAVKPILLKKERAWQGEKIIGRAAIHENIPEADLKPYLGKLLGENMFKQIHVITPNSVMAYRISKKGIIHRSKSTKEKSAPPDFSHDKAKKYILTEGMPVEPLVDLGVFTADYRIVKARYNKFRQINNFLKNIEEGLGTEKRKELHIIEFGCGKSYLTFILYYYFTKIKNINTFITGYDLNGETVDFCKGVAEKYAYKNLKFIEGDIAIDLDKITPYPNKTDVIITLHACDTATDYALYYAIKNKIDHIFSVPCCQHELNLQIRRNDEYALLLRHGLYKERFSALLTDCIRCELLKAASYSVDVVEFVGEENTPKNAMIRAHYTGRGGKNGIEDIKENRKDKIEEIKKLARDFGVEHSLINLVLSGRAGAKTRPLNNHD